MNALRLVLFIGVLSALVACAEPATTEAPETEAPSPTRVISGRVLTDPDETPIAGARVDSQGATATTDVDGRFSFPIPLNEQPGHFDVINASAEGFGRSAPRGVGTDPVTIRLKPTFAVTGRVVDGAGQPVPGALAKVRGWIDSQSPLLCAQFLREARSGADGRFRVDGISRAVSRQTLTLNAEGRGEQQIPVRIEEDVQQASLDLGPIVMSPAHTVRLTVRGPRGEPLPGVKISRSESFGESVETSAAGVAEFGHLAPGSHRFVASPEGLLMMAARVEITGEEEIVDVTMEPPFDGSLTVRVRDADGRPIPDARVRVSGFSSPAKTGEDGRVTLPGLPERAMSVYVAGPRELGFFRAQSEPVVPDGREVVVTLRKKAPVSGRVVRADGTPVGNVAVRVRDDLWGIFTSGRTAADGKFSLLAPRGVPVRVEASTSRPSSGRWKAVRPPLESYGQIDPVIAPALNCEIEIRTLPVDQSLTVRVLNPEGEPLKDVQIWINGSGGQPETNERGETTGHELVGFGVRLFAELPRRLDLVSPAPIEVVPANQTVELRFRRAAVLRGRVRLPDGSPPDRSEIELLTADGARIRTVTDAEGRFEVAVLPGQPHSLSVLHETQEHDRYRAYREGVVPGDEALDLALVLTAE